MRFTFSWMTAMMFPTTIVSADNTQKMPSSDSSSGPNAIASTRINVAKAATFTVTDMKAVTAEGAPS